MPRVWTRGLFYALVVLTAVVLPWSMLAKVDEVGSAKGRLEPKGKTVKLDTPVSGKVALISVKEGETVKAGQPLLSLDAELARTELQQAQSKLEGQLNRLAQMEFMKNQLLEVTVRTQQQQGKSEAASQLAQIDETRQRLNYSQKMRGIASTRLARDMVEVRRHEKLVKEGVIPEVRMVEVQRAVDETKWNLNQADSDVRQAEYQIKAQQNQYDSAVSSGEITVLETQRRSKELASQIADVRTEVKQTKKQIEGLQFQLQQRDVRSPIDGTLFELPTQQAGAVLQPGQTIAQIAPKNVPLVLRANMSSRESGFLEVGMPVKVKFDAYPFQDYGITEGHVAWVSPDSKMTETAQGTVESFELEITLDRPYIQTANKQIALTPGQAATGEVIVRQRRIIDFILDPFKKLQKGGLAL
ncbi:MAG: HlyD family type I secretion periplasmic adaptor subunit [Stenomitos rutilans HA7619-LM2]|nr:HlyD family type I secretion periplasmic adaptor subunit [Stenomitos rutilans HA7619-LM2]